jgi:hypothetical protein
MAAMGGNTGLGEAVRFGCFGEAGGDGLRSEPLFERTEGGEWDILLRIFEDGRAEKDCSNGFGSRSKSERVGRVSSAGGWGRGEDEGDGEGDADMIGKASVVLWWQRE